MNQTKKRLQIINIAISITDIETIQLQMLKLASLRSDEKLKEIIAGLQAQNYAQTQALITKYIETPTEEVVQRTSQQEEQEIIEQFDLFVTTPEEPEKKETELFDFDSLTEKIKKKQGEEEKSDSEKQQNVDFDNLLNLTADDVMPDNIELDISHTPKDDFFDTPAEDVPGTKESHIDTDFIPKDNFFDTMESEPETTLKTSNEKIETEKDDLFKNPIPEETQKDEPPTEENTIFQTPSIEETDTIQETKEETFFEETATETQTEKTTQTDEPAEESVQPSVVSSDKEISGYKNIPYIDQKLKNMLTQYPPLVASRESYDSVNNWLLKISNEGYSEKEVEEVISHIGKLKESNAIAEAAQLLLICGATESKYAQFMLARELFRGEILEKNLPEAFTLINRLAMDDDYPEAICDLAQLYENGIGIDKDKRKAEALYKESMDLGVKRAKAHYERLHNANKGLFGKFFGK
jgi:hypothetical protein